MKKEEKDIFVKKIFEHFGEIFEVYTINNWHRKYYFVRHQASKTDGASGTTIKGAMEETIRRLNEIGKDKMLSNLQAKKVQKKRNRETTRLNRIKKVLQARIDAEKIHWSHTCSVETIIHYAVTLRNGNVLYPSQEDVYQQITKPNRDALQELNPATNYLKKVSADWAKGRKEYTKIVYFKNLAKSPLENNFGYLLDKP